MKLPITKLPAAVLRKPSAKVDLPVSKAVRRLVMDMVTTCRAAQGIGLAAPQVGQNLSLAIVDLEEAGLPPFAIVNPEILSSSKELWEVEEGCLSLPGVYGMVSRPKKVKVRFWDLEGKSHTIEDDGWLGRVLQHEIDHLNQTLILDKWSRVTQGAQLLTNFTQKKK